MKYRRRHFTGSQRGMSLVFIVVGSAILAMAAYIGSNMITVQLKAIRKTADVREIRDLERMIDIRTDCAKTASHSHRHLYDREDVPVMPISGRDMVLNSWKVRVVSRATNGDYTIQAKKGSGNVVQLFMNTPLNCP